MLSLGFWPAGPPLGSPWLDAGDIAHLMPTDRQQRGLKAAHTRKFGKVTAEEWAATANERPFSIKDLGRAEPYSPAWLYFNGLSTHELKLECAAHGLLRPKKKYQVFANLVSHARSLVSNSASRGANGPSPAALKAKEDAPKARRALVQDLHKGLAGENEFKKLKAKAQANPWSPTIKKSTVKKLKAAYSPCTRELFTTLFPHAAGKTKVAIQPSHLRVDRIGRGRVEHVPGSLSAQFDDAGTITISGKYTMA